MYVGRPGGKGKAGRFWKKSLKDMEEDLRVIGS